MRNSFSDSILEHTGEVAIISHALASIAINVFKKDINLEKVVLQALYHDVSEVITGDLPTPIKYYNPEIKKAYREIETHANNKLISMLPEEFKLEYDKYMSPDTTCYEYKLVKGADKLSALIKCIEETKSGNGEFIKAKKSIEKSLESSELVEVKYFLTHFIKGYELTLDELD